MKERKVRVHLWWEQGWKLLYEIMVEGDGFSILPYISEFGFLGALGIKHNNLIQVVSIEEGPFLFTADHFYNSNQSTCELGSIKCKKPVKHKQNTTWIYTCCFGYSVDLLNHLSNILGFTVDLYLVEDSKYGGYNPSTGMYNGMVGDILNSKATMAIAGLTINTDRLRYIDFTAPFMRAEIGIITLKTVKEKSYFNLDFIASLGPEVQYAIIVLFSVATVLVYAFDNYVIYNKRKFNKRRQTQTRITFYPWQESFTYISGLMFQREIGGVNPSTLGGRTVAVFIAFSMVAVSTLYTASLTAEQVVKDDNKVFKGLKDEKVSFSFRLIV